MLDPVLTDSSPQVDGVAVWARAMLCTAITCNDRRAAAAILAASGGGSVLAWAWQPEAWPPSYVLAQQGRAVELSLTGTQEVKEIAVHLAGVVGLRRTARGELVNGAWASIVEGIYSAVAPLIPADTQRITLSGHSYGGGCITVALALLGHELSQGNAVVDAVTFGAPRALWAAEPSDAYARLVRVNERSDPVTTLPWPGVNIGQSVVASGLSLFQGALPLWRHTGISYQLEPDGYAYNNGYVDDSPSTFTATQFTSNFSTHYLSEYLRRLTAQTRRWYAGG